MNVGMNAGVRLGLLAFVLLLGVNPRWRFSRFMFKSRGPRSDVVCLTRRQLLAEGTKFLYLAALCFATIWNAISIADALGADLFSTAVGGGAFFIVAILMAIFALGGIYMLVRGVFRRAGYVPPPHCGGARRAPTSDEVIGRYPR